MIVGHSIPSKLADRLVLLSLLDTTEAQPRICYTARAALLMTEFGVRPTYRFAVTN